MTYEFRELNSKDIFPVLKLISAVGVKEFRSCFENDDIKRAAKKGVGDEEYQTVGIGVFLDLASIIISRLPNCENEIYSFLDSICVNLTRKEIEEMPLADFAQMVIDVIKKPEFRDFFKVVSKLLKSDT